MGSFIHGGRIVARALKAEGVSHLFTLCGGHIQAIYDGCIDEGIRVVDFRHEQTAGHAADGWSRATGEVGVCAVTAGPGVTDAVTAVATAHRAGSPMIIIGGQGPRALADMGSLQDMNHVELMRPITKWSIAVPETRRLAEYVASAFRVATSGVPGPVFLEMPFDFLMNMEDEDQVVFPKAYRTQSRPAGDPDALDRAAELLAKAEKPVVLVGAELRFSPKTEALRILAEARGEAWAPFFTSGMARGALPPDHPAFFGLCRKQALGSADVVLLMGTPLDFRLNYGRAFPPGATLISVDLDPTQIGKNRGVDVGIVGDIGLCAEALAQRLGQAGKASMAQRGWVAELRTAENARRGEMEPELASSASPPNPLRVCAELARRIKPSAMVIGDGGDFVATAAYTLPIAQLGGWIDAGPLGTLGVGPGYAAAAKLAHPERDVVIAYGDGSFGLHGLEFEALARQKINVLAVIGNDAAWTQIRRGQVAIYGEQRAVATGLDYTRYDEVVRALGCHGEWVETPEALGPALDRAFAATQGPSGKPAVVNVKIGTSDFRKGAISV